VFGGLGVLLGFVLNRYLREPERGAADHVDPDGGFPESSHRMRIREGIRIVWTSPRALLLMAAFLCSNFVAVVLLSWMPKFLYDKFHMGLAMAGLTATIFVQLASMVGSVYGGWMADWMSRRTPRGRVLVQMIGVFAGAPFVALCGLTTSVLWLIVALTAWGFFKGLYDANIFASLFDVVRPEARGTAAGFMNTVGWLGGGGSAPLVIGLIAEHYTLGLGIALASVVYIAAGILLLAAALLFPRCRESAR
jgi:sugar phosphate permease